ncbi:tegument protein UL7 [Equid alphaherpesvirus 4]|uniref:Tegument protein UL7 n=1 Tax=Equid alphaherpesvirus 4 TaxID=10331 RepID=A0A0X9ZGX8_9ALPH|nr:tegument protein UL7 [Equid alphaherpesvirus 4]AMB16170.1 tegument protein UL7 [Equid alphaherpesvirus 4]AMB16249.1 tegument protein UL7 [Equid alphaherpesvirus 4]BAV93420.1 tegument protein UL7 [Equid alphaherpesvirus 4]
MSAIMRDEIDPLAHSATVDEMVEAITNGDDLATAIVDDLVWHATPRFVTEVREVPGLPPSFTTTSITNIRVDPSGKLMLTLDGQEDAEVSCETYMNSCLNLSAFKGFSLFIVTPLEDRVNVLGVAPVILSHRLVLYLPTNIIDFTLCIIQMYLENCSPKRATSSLFVQVEGILRNISKTITPLLKMRRLMYIGATWVLNTLMSATNHNPFDQTRVLPNYMMAKMLLGHKSNTPAVLDAIYSAGYRAAFVNQPDKPCPLGVMRCKKAILNSPLCTKTIADTIYSWWTSTNEKPVPESIYVLYD